MNASCHTYEWYHTDEYVISKKKISYACLDSHWVKAHIWDFFFLSQGTHMRFFLLEMTYSSVWYRLSQGTHMRMRHVSRVDESWHTYEGGRSREWSHFVAGWRSLVGCLKLQVIFAQEPLIIGLFCRNWPIKIRHPMTLRHPVLNVWRKL